MRITNPRSTRVEDLSPGRFILLVAVIGAVLHSYPGAYLEHAGVRTILGLAIVTYGAAALLAWVAIRRRRFSVWRTALHVMLALDLADALALLLTIAMLSLDDRGQLVNTLSRQSLIAVLETALPPYLIFSPIRFFGAAALIAVGRRLPGTGRPVAAPPAAAFEN